MLLLGCLIGGLSIALLISSMHRDLDRQSQLSSEDSLILAELEQIESGIRQYLLTLDLTLANGETYLAASVGAQQELLQRGLESIADSALLADPAAIDNINANIQRIRSDIDSWAKSETESGDQAAVLDELMAKTDIQAAQLVELFGKAMSVAQARVAEASLQLENRRKFVGATTLLVAALYGIFILLLWRWSSQHVRGPLIELSRAGKASIEERAPFAIKPRGPTEVAEVTRHLGILVSDLEGKVRHRTSEIRRQNRDLKAAKRTADEARKAAESANAAKSEFVARMSHEIRTPMNGVLGMAELLMCQDLKPAHRDHVEVIMNSGRGLLTIIDDLLDFAKIEAGKFELSNEPFDAGSCIDETLALFAQNAAKNDIQLLSSVDNVRNLRVLGDEVRFRQVLSNLISNAIKFTDAGEVAVRTEVNIGSADRTAVRVLVSDTGIGIGLEDIERVFDSFTQADGSNTRQYGGTGLGLAICKELVNLMGGEIGASSDPGKGSTFWFDVPFNLAAEADSAELREHDLLRSFEDTTALQNVAQ